MNTSLFELFKIGIGPSSSHTVGPMRAALRFSRQLQSTGLLSRTASVNVDLYGSLALTGIGHGTDRAILLGLLGEAPDTVDPASVETKIIAIHSSGSLLLNGTKTIPFTEADQPPLPPQPDVPRPNRPTHPNGMRFTAFDATGTVLANEVFYSVGGGFIVSEAERHRRVPHQHSHRPLPLLAAQPSSSLLAEQHHLTIADLVLANEVALLEDPSISINRPKHASEQNTESPEEKIRTSILAIWQVMQQCTERGIATEGILPGGLNVRRRAHRLAERLNTIGSKDPLAAIDWVTLYAMAVNEENAAGGRVVTAPTNGAAGVIPAIAHYYTHFIEGHRRKKNKKASSATSSPPPPSASSTRRTPASPAPKSAARARSA